jgi:tRNA G18 (ribose-2'-O)-methylase SpoU
VPLVHIADPADERLTDYRAVPDPELVERRGAFIAEGRLVVRRLLTGSRFVARSVMLTETALASMADVVGDTSSLPVYVVPQAVMNGIAGFNIHRGCLAIGNRRADDDAAALIEGARRLVLLERVSNADNVGCAFRNAAAFAADAVLLGPSCADPLYRKTIRTSMGAALTVPFAHLHSWPTSLHHLRTLAFAVIGMTPDAHAVPLREVVRTLSPSRAAVLVGHEGEGLTPQALALCTHRARIPMASGTDSVNVATAAAIALYELSQ